MRELVNQRATVIFGVLVLLTCISFWLTVGHGGAELHQSGSVIWTLVIVLASLKVRWVMLDFMELRSAPTTLRLLCESWVIGVGAFLIATTWLVA
jgi:Prokaryotic Cytochrome C oxidase subunit IV